MGEKMVGAAIMYVLSAVIEFNQHLIGLDGTGLHLLLKESS